MEHQCRGSRAFAGCEWQTICARLESGIAAKLLGLSPMKTILKYAPAPTSGRRYWRSLDDLADTSEFKDWLHREFPAGASQMEDGQTRRNFLKIMSASFAFAGLGLAGAGCRRPEENLEPYGKQPADYV